MPQCTVAERTPFLIGTTPTTYGGFMDKLKEAGSQIASETKKAAGIPASSTNAEEPQISKSQEEFEKNMPPAIRKENAERRAAERQFKAETDARLEKEKADKIAAKQKAEADKRAEEALPPVYTEIKLFGESEANCAKKLGWSEETLATLNKKALIKTLPDDPFNNRMGDNTVKPDNPLEPKKGDDCTKKLFGLPDDTTYGKIATLGKPFVPWGVGSACFFKTNGIVLYMAKGDKESPEAFGPVFIPYVAFDHFVRGQQGWEYTGIKAVWKNGQNVLNDWGIEYFVTTIKSLIKSESFYAQIQRYQSVRKETSKIPSEDIKPLGGYGSAQWKDDFEKVASVAKGKLDVEVIPDEYKKSPDQIEEYALATYSCNAPLKVGLLLPAGELRHVIQKDTGKNLCDISYWRSFETATGAQKAYTYIFIDGKLAVVECAYPESLCDKANDVLKALGEKYGKLSSFTPNVSEREKALRDAAKMIGEQQTGQEMPSVGEKVYGIENENGGLRVLVLYSQDPAMDDSGKISLTEMRSKALTLVYYSKEMQNYAQQKLDDLKQRKAAAEKAEEEKAKKAATSDL
jgi:hypothetical protein